MSSESFIDKVFQVEELEKISFDENGKEEGIWKGPAVTKIDDPANFCIECRDIENADKLCEFLNDIKDVASPVMGDIMEWSSCVTALSRKERELLCLKTDFNEREFDVLINFDFKGEYGKDNDKIRKGHIREQFKDLLEDIEDLELSINYLNRRISFLKQLVHAKTVLMEIKE